MVVAITAACAFSAQFQVRNGHPSLRLSRARTSDGGANSNNEIATLHGCQAEKHHTTGRILRGIVHHSNFGRLTSGPGQVLSKYDPAEPIRNTTAQPPAADKRRWGLGEWRCVPLADVSSCNKIRS
jgi:hypothetical protein